MSHLYRCFWAACSLTLLIGCTPDDAINQQSQKASQKPILTPSAAQPPSEGRQAYIDPQTGELAPPPSTDESQFSQRSGQTENDSTTYDYVINEHGNGVLVPRNPQRHELNAQIDCNGELRTTHGNVEQLKYDFGCVADKKTKGEK